MERMLQLSEHINRSVKELLSNIVVQPLKEKFIVVQEQLHPIIPKLLDQLLLHAC